MGGETEQAVSGWTTDTLHVHVQRQINDLRDLLDERAENQKVAMSAALSAADRATVKAELAADKRFESVNEFRAQLTDQAATFLSRREAEARLEALAERMAHIEQQLSTMRGQGAGASEAEAGRRASTQQTTAIVGAVLFAVSIAVALILGLNT